MSQTPSKVRPVPLRITAEVHVLPGKEDEFRTVVKELVRSVHQHDRGTSIYDWYISSDGRTAFVHEHYESNEAFLEHAQNVAGLIVQLAGTARFGASTFAGEPSQAIRDLVAHAGGEHATSGISLYRRLA